MEMRPSSSEPIAHNDAASERNTPRPFMSGRFGPATRNAAVAPIIPTSAARTTTAAAGPAGGS